MAAEVDQKRKKTAVLYSPEADVDRLADFARRRLVPVTKVVDVLTANPPLLDLDDKLLIEYKTKKGVPEIKVGGYYNFYDAGARMLVTRAGNQSVSKALGSKRGQIAWDVDRITRFFIKVKTSERIVRTNSGR